MAIKKRKNPTKRQTRKKVSYFANLGRTLRSVGYKGKISNLKTVEAREAVLMNRKWELDDGVFDGFSRRTLDFIKGTSKPSKKRKNPAHQGLMEPMNLAAVAAGAFIVHCCVK